MAGGQISVRPWGERSFYAEDRWHNPSASSRRGLSILADRFASAVDVRANDSWYGVHVIPYTAGSRIAGCRFGCPGGNVRMSAAVAARCSCLPRRFAPETVATPIQARGLHNAFRVSDRIYSGSSPDGDEGFAELKRLESRPSSQWTACVRMSRPLDGTA